ncbi:MAG TPA: serine dehydrogenasease [Candidatus Kapabacteria bacterium]|nr:serine dehydrogenasease [Candidatus Kapabacteria bacterium]
MATLRPIDDNTKQQLNQHLEEVEKSLDADAIAIVSPIVSPLDGLVKKAIELFSEKRHRLAVILDTLGGIAEVVERLVSTIRHYYDEVYFIIPDRAMSAGTLFAMSGDKIFMSYFSVLGPIDPQIEKDGKLVPALSYLSQYQRLCIKADKGQLNTAEYALLNKLDLGELHQFEQARELSIDLLENWLSRFKFKDWEKHNSTGDFVHEDEKRDRAKDIGISLSNNERWHSHGRGITRETLTSEIRLKIDKIEDNHDLLSSLDAYFELLKDYMQREQYPYFIHTREYF